MVTTDFDIGINRFGVVKHYYSLFVNGNRVREKIPDMEEVVREIKKYLRLRFKEKLR